MKISQLLSYTFLTITITTTYALAENHVDDVSLKQNDHRIKKRSATVLIEPSEVGQYTHGTVVYRKNPNRFGYKRRKPSSWKAQGTPKIPKKVRRYPKPPIYGTSRKSRTPKPLHRPKYKAWTSKPHKKTMYKAPVKTTTYKHRDPLPTFAEPPFRDQYTSTFGEPPHTPTSSISSTHKIVGSFTTTKGQEFQPPAFNAQDMYKNKNRDTNKYLGEDFTYPQYQYDGPEEISASNINQHRVNIFDDEEVAFGQEFKRPVDHFEENYMDNTAEFSKHHPVYAKPHPSPNAIHDDLEIKHHSVDSFTKIDDVTQYPTKEYTRPKTYSNWHVNHNKFMNVRMKDHLLGSDDDADQLLVGGKYAEPPARMVQKQIRSNHPSKHHMVAPFFRGFEGSAFVSNDDDDNDLRIQSASMSPYVNYKNSNMAFSPQNLNDAFGIVEK